MDEVERQCWSSFEGLRWALKIRTLTCSTVFRATHESSKAMRIWMGEMKKKR